VTTPRIDVHTHFLPDFYCDALVDAGQSPPDGIKGLPEWSEQAALSTMDRLGVTTSMLSISSPGTYFGDPGKAAALSRAVNEEAARLRERNPGRFGFFASLPLPSIDDSLDELRFALDELHADGIVVETNHEGMYLGDERLEQIYAEIASRSSVVFIHPATAHNGAHLGLGYPRPMLEFMFETTRSVTNLVLSGMLQRHSGARFIVPHAGAGLSVFANRVELLLPILTVPGTSTPPSLRAALKDLHFDLAGAPVDELLGALLAVADPSKIHYGSDYPFTPADAGVALLDRLEHTELLDSELKHRIFTENPLRLFPQLATAV